jgi:hypothetical protein
MSLNRLYGWWVGEDDRVSRVSVYSLTDKVTLDLSARNASPGNNISGHMRVDIADASKEKRVVLALMGKEEVRLRQSGSFLSRLFCRAKVLCHRRVW